MRLGGLWENAVARWAPRWLTGWQQRRAGRWLVGEARARLRRAGSDLPAAAAEATRASLGALERALAAGDPVALAAAYDGAEAALGAHLAAYARPAWRESVDSISFAVVVALLLRAFVVEAFKIPSGSMIPTLAIGDQIFVNKFIYGLRVPFTSIRLVDFGLPARGDVVVFICPVAPHDDFIKRVIGLPGDEVEVRGGVVYVNREPLPRRPLTAEAHWDRGAQGEGWRPFTAQGFEERLGSHTYTVLQEPSLSRQATDFRPQLVPAGHLFVMGDNRDHSYDSRFWGPVPQQNVLGRSLFIWWSWGHEGLDRGRLFDWIH